jgi:hypothetical protein
VVVINELDADWAYLERDPLIGRLRALKWTDTPGDVRERCWESVSSHLAAMPDAPSATDRPRTAARQTGERYDFSRRLMTRRLSVAQGWARRPIHVSALAHIS